MSRDLATPCVSPIFYRLSVVLSVGPARPESTIFQVKQVLQLFNSLREPELLKATRLKRAAA